MVLDDMMTGETAKVAKGILKSIFAQLLIPRANCTEGYCSWKLARVWCSLHHMWHLIYVQCSHGSADKLNPVDAPGRLSSAG